MKNIESKLKQLRVNARNHFKQIIDCIIDQHRSKITICIFCGSNKNLTREHVLPRWLYGKHGFKFFIDNTNKQNQNYESATVPCCRDCNNNILNSLEKYICTILSSKEVGKNLYSPLDYDNIIRWFEIIDYKFQVLDLQKKFIRHRDGEFIEYLKNIPLTMMKDNHEGSPTRAFKVLRESLRRITTKSKDVKENSLLFMTTSNKESHFMHGDGHMIFIELPQFNKALFYFLSKNFKNNKTAIKQAKKIIGENY